MAVLYICHFEMWLFLRCKGLVGEFCYCTVEMAEQRKNTQQYQLGVPFSETCSFLVYNLTADRVRVMIY
jgi:hypothetical protein